MGICDGDESNLADGQVSNHGVVGGETKVVGDGCGAGARTGEDATCVEVDSAFVDGCESSAHREISEVPAALHGSGPGSGVEGLNVSEESAWGLERIGVFWEEGRGEDHGRLGVGVDIWVKIESRVDEEDNFEEISRAADPGSFFEAFEHGGAHAGGVEGSSEGPGASEGGTHELNAV